MALGFLPLAAGPVELPAQLLLDRAAPGLLEARRVIDRDGEGPDGVLLPALLPVVGLYPRLDVGGFADVNRVVTRAVAGQDGIDT
jgi:hypothetical protein